MGNDREIAQILRELQFSAGLGEEDLLKLAALGELVQFAAGSVIFSEGSRITDLYLLRSGRVELCMNVPARGCMPILTLAPGDLLGWSEVLTMGEMTATATAVKDTELVRIDARQLSGLCARDHDIGYEMMRRIGIALSQRLVATRLQVLDLFAQPTVGASDAVGEQA